MPADLAFLGGTVLTVDADFRIASALAVEGNRIAAVGTERDIETLIGPATRVVDLACGALLPGINDSHLHGAMLGAYWPKTWLAGFADGGFPAPRSLDTDEERRAALRRAWDVLLPLGITSYTEPGLGPGADGQHGDSCGEATLQLYRSLADAGELPVRVTALLLFGEIDGPATPADLVAGLRRLGALTAGDGGPSRLRIAGVKVFADGIPPMHSAWQHEPYPDGSHGSLLVPGADDSERLAAFAGMIRHVHRAGLQVGVHATGSRAIEEFARVLAAEDDVAARRHYVIHGDCVTPATLAVMARHGIGLNAQPSILAATGPMLSAAIGPRAHEALPLRAAIDAGIPVCLSSDGPVVAPDWRASIATAISRESQAITLVEALRAYTINGARQDGAEAWKGSLEVGKVADLCVLARDPFELTPEELAAVEVRMTVVDGQVAYER